ncbi:MAG: DNA-3-methyladenine glycosylase family protein [Vulcanimicrobiaceae bacterium]
MPAASDHSLTAVAPYRLDLTVNVLRRFSTNLVDRFTADGRYLRALAIPAGAAIVEVAQTEPTRLAVRLHQATGDRAALLATVGEMLGVDRELGAFNRGSDRIPWLRSLARRMRGVKPPRYPTLWEACVNAVVFQQVSIHAAGAILGRAIAALGQPHSLGDVSLHAFPRVEQFAAAEPEQLRGFGLSAGKVATLQRIAAALADGALDARTIEPLDSPAAAQALCAVKGIGPWTAAVMLLRGFGRLDVFPAGDSGVARSLRHIAGDAPVDVEQALGVLGAQRGMLYYHLLLARLEAKGLLAAGT